MGEFVLGLDEPSVQDHITRCRACKHTLRTPESQTLGIGPECAAKLGLAPRRPLRITGLETWRDCEGQIDLLERKSMTRVWMTEAGDRYHSSSDCRDLNAGQKSGEGRATNYARSLRSTSARPQTQARPHAAPAEVQRPDLLGCLITDITPASRHSHGQPGNDGLKRACL
ncbi:DUF6011 domain-containing protein [Nonomuraea sp. NPDC050786]|uniref:DUF6011 domain-containing protein n=1 Tax=Nonomuraea sp. NPDC050786 TaxID=3154840 RepID=UPI0033EBE19B